MLESVHGGSAATNGGKSPPHGPADPLGGAILDAAGEARAALVLDDPVKAVHELRKAFKRLRALLRLVRRGTSTRGAAAEARALRARLSEAARRLSGARDSAARREALDDLAAKELITPALRKAAARALVPRASKAQQAGLAPHRGELEEAILASEGAAGRLAGLMGTAELLRAMTGDYAKARKLGRAVDPGHAESVHELRKAVVVHRYQMALVTRAWPAVGEVWEVELQRLRDKLGKFQDLAVLLDQLTPPEERMPAPDWQAPLTEAARARQLKLTRSALRLHARLFAETPKAFRRRLAAYFAPVSDRE